ncbi:hypothetical protein O0555_00270 [Brevibacillus laterosporus]|uniref:hypothetical protein n=1 Tax=Brevibacillus laterosporus TaxID=1465 RepID=UPI0015E2365B|nr:hypothetical protein [Brevibacillus laterosporus]MCR8935797.1 hypothetical protein [Brevibacillus laterosporus]MCZ0838436.1 hypothetical protein [Brevibacillus laterosporus]MCZ0844491.1 hypothetical protein [Brevibacillus laterosporus]MED1913266.1 hypothetical protein [Brevibacillus laterosporus]
MLEWSVSDPIDCLQVQKDKSRRGEYKKNLEEVMCDERLIGRSHPPSEERPTVKD